MSVVKDACRKAFQAQPQRLMAAMYSCDISVDQKVLGKSFTIALYPLYDVELHLILGDLNPFQNQKKFVTCSLIDSLDTCALRPHQLSLSGSLFHRSQE